MELLQSTVKRIPVVLADSAGNTKTGVAFGAVTCYIQKQDGVAVVKNVTVTDWFEIDAVNMPGHYDLKLSAADTDTLGFLRVVLLATGSTGYSGLVQVRKGTSDEIFTQAQRAKRILEGKWVIDPGTNTLTLFDADGSTALNIYDLYGSDLATPTSSKIFKRVPRNPIT